MLSFIPLQFARLIQERAASDGLPKKPRVATTATAPTPALSDRCIVMEWLL